MDFWLQASLQGRRRFEMWFRGTQTRHRVRGAQGRVGDSAVRGVLLLTFSSHQTNSQPEEGRKWGVG